MQESAIADQTPRRQMPARAINEPQTAGGGEPAVVAAGPRLHPQVPPQARFTPPDQAPPRRGGAPGSWRGKPIPTYPTRVAIGVPSTSPHPHRSGIGAECGFAERRCEVSHSTLASDAHPLLSLRSDITVVAHHSALSENPCRKSRLRGSHQACMTLAQTFFKHGNYS